MKLQKAIEILELNAKKAGKKMHPDTLDALKLGIEASKEVMSLRGKVNSLVRHILPGENSLHPK